MSISENQDRLIRLAKLIKNEGSLSAEDKEFVSDAMLRIGNGEDANSVLGVKGKRGKRKSADARISDINKQLMLGWICTARCSRKDGGLGMTLEEACAEAESLFGLTQNTIKKYWNENPRMRRLDIPLIDEQIEQWQTKKKIPGRVYELQAKDMAASVQKVKVLGDI